MAKNRIIQEGAFDRTNRVICNQNFADVGRCSTQLDVASSTTLTDVAGMTTDGISIVAGTYLVKIFINGVSTTNGGFKIALKQSTSGMLTTVGLGIESRTAAAITYTRFTTITDAASIFASNAAAFIGFLIEGVITVNAPGTLKLQVAQNASSADTTSVYTDSYMTVTMVV